MGTRADLVRAISRGWPSPILLTAALMAATSARAQVPAGPPLPLPPGPALGPVDPATPEDGGTGALQKFFPGLPLGQADDERKKREDDQAIGGVGGGLGGAGARGGSSGSSGTSTGSSNTSSKNQGASSFTVLNPDDIRNAALLPGGLPGAPSSSGNSGTTGSQTPASNPSATLPLPTNPVRIGAPFTPNSTPLSGLAGARPAASHATAPRSLATPSPAVAGRSPQYRPTFLGSKPGATAGPSRRSTGQVPTFLGKAPGTRAAVHKPPVGVGSLARPNVQLSPVHHHGAAGASAHHPGGAPAHHAGAAHHAAGGGHSGGHR